jgi:hypothetical protein
MEAPLLPEGRQYVRLTAPGGGVEPVRPSETS